jgi:hypothetical protein
MALVMWTSSSNGDWLTAADWSTGAVPGATDDVQIEVPSITVTLSTGTLAANSLTTSGSTLSVGGGTLSVTGTATVGGAYSQSGGTVALGNTSTWALGATQTGGLLHQVAGQLIAGGAFAESGGTLQLAGQGIFNAALTLGSGTITAAGQLISNQALSQSGGTLFLGGGATLHGTAVQTGGLMELGAGSLLSYGAFTEAGGDLALYDQGATFNTLTLQSGTIASFAAVLQVDGAFAQTGGVLNALGRDIDLAGGFTQAASTTIDVQSGTLALQSTGSLAGTVSGAGSLVVQSGTTTLAAGVVLSLPTVAVRGGMLALAADTTLAGAFANYGSNGVLAMQGHTLTVSGTSALDGEISGRGTLVAAGGGQLNGLSLDGTSVLDITSSVNQTGNMTVSGATGSRAQLDIAKAGHLRIAGNFSIFDQSANGLLDNAGSLAKTGGSGLATIYTNVISTGGLAVNIGELAFAGPTDSIGNSVSGAGTFAVTAGQATFSKGLKLTVGHVLLAQGNEQLTLAGSISYAGEYSQAGGTLWLNGPGVTLTTTGQTGLDGGLLTGSGTLVTTAASHVNISAIDLEGSATLDVSGTVVQTTSVGVGQQQGSAAGVIIEAGAVWKLENNSSLGGTPNAPLNENGTIINDGVLEKLNGSANSDISGTLVSTGTLSVGNSTLTLYGSGTLGGTVSGKGALDLRGSYTLASGLALSAGKLGIGTGAAVALGGNLADANSWAQSDGTLLLGGNTLTLSGATSLEGGTLVGPGSVLARGATVLGDGEAISQGTLAVSGQTDQVGDITVGDYSPLGGFPNGGTQPPSAATLQIAAGSTYKLDDSVNIASNGTLSVAGTFTALGGTLSSIGPSVVDNGTILANSAQLRFLGPVSGAGGLSVGAGGTLDFAGSVAASNTVSFTGGTGALFLEDPVSGNTALTFGATIAGFQSGDVIELANLSANTSLVSLSLNGAGTVLSVTDTSGDSASLTFSTAQTLSSFSLGLGAHGDLAVFHS